MQIKPLAVVSRPRLPSPRRIAYRDEAHADAPHVVKFSGGRSSAALTFMLAENGLLRPDRGDAILFANTSAEHPATYDFARKCKERLEGEFGLPFFWYEFCTVEDARRGAYGRQAAYRLVTSDPIEVDPRGYRSSGEVFEEMLSFQGMLPNPHSRSCTAKLKLFPSHQLLAEWFGSGSGPRHAGHHSDRRYVTPERALERYRGAGGAAPEEEFLERVAYMTERPANRGAQAWKDYTRGAIARPSGAPPVAAMWGPEARLHVTLLGLRADEDGRMNRILERSLFAEGAGTRACAVRTQPPGERPCFPLADWEMDQKAVRQYWSRRDFDLEAPDLAGNCVFCFMKGTKALGRAARVQDPSRVKGAPSDIEWWVRIERKYRREVPSRNKEGISKFGFFGVRGPTFAALAAVGGSDSDRFARNVQACDCTD